jgi:hypothetical protein
LSKIFKPYIRKVNESIKLVYLLLFYTVILLKKIEDVMKNLWGICEDKNRYV